MAGVCLYAFCPWYYVSELFPEKIHPIDNVRRVARVLSGLFGAAVACYVGYLAAKATYDGVVKFNAKVENATSPYPDEVTSIDAKVGGGVAATVVFYFVASHITVATYAVGGVVADCILGCGKECCQKTADCFNWIFSCCYSKPKNDTRKPEVDKPGMSA